MPRIRGSGARSGELAGRLVRDLCGQAITGPEIWLNLGGYSVCLQNQTERRSSGGHGYKPQRGGISQPGAQAPGKNRTKGQALKARYISFALPRYTGLSALDFFAGHLPGACAPGWDMPPLVSCEVRRKDRVTFRRRGRTPLRPGSPEPAPKIGHRPSFLTPWRIGSPGVSPGAWMFTRSARRASP